MTLGDPDRALERAVRLKTLVAGLIRNQDLSQTKAFCQKVSVDQCP